MPVSCHVLVECELSVMTFRGIVTDEQFVAGYEMLFRDSGARPGFSELGDLRQVLALDVTLDALTRVARMTEEFHRSAGATTKSALVMPRPFDEMIARLYRAVVDERVECCQRFAELPSALRWLGFEGSLENTIAEIDRLADVD